MLSVAMAWEAFLPSGFATVFWRPLRDWLEMSYFLPVATSLVVLGAAGYRAIGSAGPLKFRVLRLFLAAVWCAAVLFCAVLMGVRTAI